MSQTTLTLLGWGVGHRKAGLHESVAPSSLEFLLHFPIGGQHHLIVDGVERRESPGMICYMNGSKTSEHIFDSDVNFLWIHFAPDDLWLKVLLQNCEPWMEWRGSDTQRWQPVLERIAALHQGHENRLLPIPDSQMDLMLETQALLAFHLAQVLKTGPRASNSQMRLALDLKPAVDFIDENWRRKVSLAEIAEVVHLVPSYFHRKFKNAFDMTPRAYLTRKRMNAARHLLATTGLAVQEIADQLGYQSPFYFSRAFSRYFGVSPTAMRSGDNLS